MKKKVIITDHLHPYLAEQLFISGFDVDVQADITNDQLAEIIHKYNGLVLSTKILVTPQLINSASQLEFIARAGSGMENINVEYARSKNIHIINSPKGNANAVGEHTMALLLGLLNNIVKSDSEIRKGIWQREKNRGIELEGKTIGIIGYGNTGSAFAAKLEGFNVTIYVFDKYKKGFGNSLIIESTVEEIQEKADFISFHVPHNPETHHYLNSDFIGRFRKSIRILNTSRGKIVNTAHLIEALKNGKISGAALDVFENEQFYKLTGIDKMLMDELCKMENVILTPHVAGWTHESYFKISKILFDRIDDLNLKKVN